MADFEENTIGTASSKQYWYAVAGYSLTITVFVASSFFPQQRIWGLIWWAYFGIGVPIALCVVGLAAPFLLHRLSFSDAGSGSNIHAEARRFKMQAIGVFVVLVAAFYLLRGQTHFLGDGYQLLARLARSIPSPKIWDKGVSFLNSFVYSLMPGNRKVALYLRSDLFRFSPAQPR